jgi:hypothetical protein
MFSFVFLVWSWLSLLLQLKDLKKSAEHASMGLLDLYMDGSWQVTAFLYMPSRWRLVENERRYLEGFAAGFGEAESGGGGRRGGRHHRAGAAVHLAVALLRRSRRRGGVSAGRGGRRGRHWRHERRRGGAGVGRAVVVAFQRPGHVDAEIEP